MKWKQTPRQQLIQTVAFADLVLVIYLESFLNETGIGMRYGERVHNNVINVVNFCVKWMLQSFCL